MRFDRNEIGDIVSEIAAYGAALTAERIDDATPRAATQSSASSSAAG